MTPQDSSLHVDLLKEIFDKFANKAMFKKFLTTLLIHVLDEAIFDNKTVNFDDSFHALNPQQVHITYTENNLFVLHYYNNRGRTRRISFYV